MKIKKILIILLIITMVFSGCTKPNGSDNNSTVNQDYNTEGYLGMSLPADFQIFSEDSPWNTPIPKDAEVDENSKVMIKTIKYALTEELGQQALLKIAYDKWTSPIHVIDSEKSPFVKVKAKSYKAGAEKSFHPLIDPNQDNVVELRFPHNVWQDPENDSHMVLVDPNKRVAWEFSFFEKSGNEFMASRIVEWDLDGPGFFEPFSGKKWWRFGADGAGTPLVAGLVRIEEMRAGKIEHAISIVTPTNRRKLSEDADYDRELCLPAANSDGWAIGEEFIPEGARLQLNPDLDMDAFGLTEETKIIARALQEYGAIVMDNSLGFHIKFQNLGEDGGEWKEYENKINIQNIPIDEFRVLKCEIATK